MSNGIKYFLIGLSLIIFSSITIFIVILLITPVPFENYNAVDEKDWSDDWEKTIIEHKAVAFERFKPNSNGYYIIHNFLNKDIIVNEVINLVDSVKSIKTDSSIYFIFLWNRKYNHVWRVEYMNEEYIEKVATLFDINIVYPLKEKKIKYLFKEMKLYPALKKKYLEKIKINIIKTYKKATILETNYEKGFDFFLWKELQDFTQKLAFKDNKNMVFILKDNNDKVIVQMQWNIKEKGYSIYFP